MMVLELGRGSRLAGFTCGCEVEDESKEGLTGREYYMFCDWAWIWATGFRIWIG